MLKHEIKNILIKFLFDGEIFNPSALSSVLETQADLYFRELEIQRQIQLEKLRWEQEKKRTRLEQMERKERILQEKLAMEKEKLAMEKEKLEMEERIQKEKNRTGRKRKRELIRLNNKRISNAR